MFFPLNVLLSDGEDTLQVGVEKRNAGLIRERFPISCCSKTGLSSLIQSGTHIFLPVPAMGVLYYLSPVIIISTSILYFNVLTQQIQEPITESTQEDEIYT
jgi:hypothetical protein